MNEGCSIEKIQQVAYIKGTKHTFEKYTLTVTCLILMFRGERKSMVC